MQRYEPKPWDIRRCDMVRADDGGYVRYDDASAEIERLKKERDQWRNDCLDANQSELMLRKRAEKAEAERDQAVAAAFKVAAIELEVNWGHMATPEMRDAILHKTPADAKSALEAYGREREREGMRMAADKIMDRINNTDFAMNYHAPLTLFCKSILAEMEKLK